MYKIENKFSNLIAIEITKLSYPAKFLLSKQLLQGKIIDFGCGFGSDVKLLQVQGFNITGYDPYYFYQYSLSKNL